MRRATNSILVCILLIAVCMCAYGDAAKIKVPKMRYLFYDVKLGEGFNLQKEVRLVMRIVAEDDVG